VLEVAKAFERASRKSIPLEFHLRRFPAPAVQSDPIDCVMINFVSEPFTVRPPSASLSRTSIARRAEMRLATA